MISKGCQNCMRSGAASGTCHICGRKWGACAIEGVHPSSPCPANPDLREGMKTHSWRGTVGHYLCRACGARQASMQDTSTPEEVSGDTVDEAENPALTPLEALKAGMQTLVLQYNQMGDQLKQMVHALTAAQEVDRHKVFPGQVKKMTEKEFKEYKRQAKRKAKRDQMKHPCCEHITRPTEGWVCETCGRTWVDASREVREQNSS